MDFYAQAADGLWKCMACNVKDTSTLGMFSP